MFSANFFRNEDSECISQNYSYKQKKKQHQRIAIFLYMQREAEQVAALSLRGATLQTLQPCLHRNLVQVLDFKSLGRENKCKEVMKI